MLSLLSAKKINGRKRHILVDTLGLLLSVYVTPADLHDSKGARRLLGAVMVAEPGKEPVRRIDFLIDSERDLVRVVNRELHTDQELRRGDQRAGKTQPGQRQEQQSQPDQQPGKAQRPEQAEPVRQR